MSAASPRRSALQDGLESALTPASAPKAPGSWAPASRCRFEGLTIPKGTPPSPLRLIPAFFRLLAWTGSPLPLSDSPYPRIPGPPLMVRPPPHSHLGPSPFGAEPAEGTAGIRFAAALGACALLIASTKTFTCRIAQKDKLLG